MKDKLANHNTPPDINTDAPLETFADYRKARESWYPGCGNDRDITALITNGQYAVLLGLQGPESNFSDGVPGGASLAEFYLQEGNLRGSATYIELAREVFASYPEEYQREIIDWLEINANTAHIDILTDDVSSSYVYAY